MMFQSNNSLRIVDFPSVTSIQASAFSGCGRLTTFILRSDSLCSLGNISAFKDCHHLYGTVNSVYNPNGLQDGYIYVPRALIEYYKVETNWSDFATQLRALEDYTIDGTITGELDESKI